MHDKLVICYVYIGSQYGLRLILHIQEYEQVSRLVKLSGIKVTKTI